MDPEEMADEILTAYDEAVSDVSLDLAIEVAEALFTGIKGRLDGLRDDKARA